MTDTAEAPEAPKPSRARRSSKKELTDAAKHVPQGPQEPGQTDQPNAVIVHRIEDAEGNLNVDVQTIGNVRVTEVETLLKLGQKLTAGRLGVE